MQKCCSAPSAGGDEVLRVKKAHPRLCYVAQCPVHRRKMWLPCGGRISGNISSLVIATCWVSPSLAFSRSIPPLSLSL